MMDNEIVIVGENMMIWPKWYLNFCLKNRFHEQRWENSRNIVMEWVSPPTFSIVVNNIIYLLHEKLGCLENK
jgi:hypothetical protein